jgi:hypothetical protein
MIRSLLLVLSVLEVLSSFAQVVHGNEWIDHSRRYWRFEVFADGLVRIDSAALASSGFPVATVDPAEYMLFAREKQVPIYIQGGEDGVLNSGDFIEFFGQRNDAWLDAKMYSQPGHLANPYYSQYNDTIRYFLTWDPVAPKERVVPYANIDFASQPVRPYFVSEVVSGLVGAYRPGSAEASSGVTSGFMLEGEGWFHTQLLQATASDVEQVRVLTTARAYLASDAPPARVFTVSASTNEPGGISLFDHHLRVAYGPNAPGTVAMDTIFRGVKVIRSSFEVPVSSLGANLSVRFQVPYDLFAPGQIGASNPANYADRQVISHLGIRYARDFTFQNNTWARMWLPNDGTDALAHIDFSGISGAPVVYAWGDSLRRIMPTQSGNRWKAMVPPHAGASETQTVVIGTAATTSIMSLVPVNGNGQFTDFETLESDSAMLIVTHATLREGVEEYATYRRTSPKNPMPVVIADVDELYDQFGGGIPKHAFAIRRFARYIVNTWSTDPQAMFLIGKSVQTAKTGGVDGYRPDSNGAYARCLVPSYGYPSSDPCFTIGLRFDTRKVDIPLGRLSASNVQEVRDYLEKVRTFESQPPAVWMKNILHFRGGFTTSENNLFATYMNGWKQLAEGTYFGGRVVDFSKTSSDIIQQASADSVRMLIEEGVTLMSFFAHAYANGFDITIDNPENYEWNGRYPMVIGNSCYIGNIHLNSNTSTSEDWVMLPEKGPIAFLASVDAGIAPFLNPYSREFYRSFSQLNYGKSIGEHMRHATFQQLSSSSDIRSVNNVHTFTLQGDPALILNSWPEPDYSVSTQDIFFDPASVSADVDTFDVKVVVTNIGKAVNADVNVALERSNSGLTGVQSQLVGLSNVYLRDTAFFRVPTQGFSGGQGINQFMARVDLDPDEIPELDDIGNNSANSALFITSGDLVPTYPYNFAIVPEPTPMLKASTGDPFAPQRNYVFQIDTADTFDSPVLETATLSAPGGVVGWQPVSVYAQTVPQDSTVYFWRCSIDSTGNGGYNWYERSFQYIPGKQGWGQAQFFQFKNNTFDGVEHERPDRAFEFYSGIRTIRAQVRGSSTASSNDSTGWFMELTAQDYNGCNVNAAWHVVVIDPANFRPWGTYWNGENPDNRFSNQNDGTNCRDRVEYMFAFRTNVDSQMVGMQNMLADRVPDGHHLLFYTWKYLDKDGMANNAPGLLPLLEQLGVPDWNSLPDSVPMIFYVRKGFPATYQAVLGNSPVDYINMQVQIDGLSDRGEMTTMEAGPASAWYKLYWNDRPLNPADSTLIQVRGVTPSGAEVELFEFPATQDSVPDLGALVNAQEYPVLRLRGRFFDIGTADPAPSHLERWQLLNAPVPECAIDPPSGYLNALNDLFEGQDARVVVAVRNISEFDMDSLLMGAWVIDRNNVRHNVHYRLNAPLPAGALLLDTISFPTLDLGGANTLVIEANTVDSLTGAYHQQEQYRFNNIAQIRFLVEEDNENPLLDVTFDGMRILNGDVVSAKPEIRISLNDENTVLLMDSPADTAYFKVFLAGPSMPLQRIYFRDGAGMDNLQFVPANGPDNECYIIHRPNFMADGKYTLTVQASDKSNNRSGDYDYKIDFEVINRPTITEVLNYPNPFTTSTRFVFTVTGSEAPTYMKIQIMTVTGRVVREVRMHELGPVRVGRNISEFAWDGTDEFGDKLARGVYLYRVIAQLNGQDIEYRSTGASEYFSKGMGKMYLLR